MAGEYIYIVSFEDGSPETGNICYAEYYKSAADADARAAELNANEKCECLCPDDDCDCTEWFVYSTTFGPK